MPPSATSISPFLLLSAPVKAPRTWPNSSDSSSVSGTAPQLTATNGRSRRSELKWIARATSSLPVPDSPPTSTVLLVLATISIVENTACIASLRPMMLENSWRVFSARFSSRFSCFSRLRLEVLPDLQPQLVHAERLREVVDRAEPHRLDRGVGGRERRHHERDDVAVEVLGRAQDLDAADVGHPDVGQQQIDRLALQLARSPARPFSATTTS